MGRDPATTDRRCARARLRLVALLMPAPCGCPPETFVSRVVMKRQNASFMSSFTASTAFLLNLSRMIPTAYRRASMDAVFSTARMPRNKVARKGLPWWLAMRCWGVWFFPLARLSAASVADPVGLGLPGMLAADAPSSRSRRSQIMCASKSRLM